MYILELCTTINIHSPLTHTPCFQNIHSFVEESPNFGSQAPPEYKKPPCPFSHYLIVGVCMYDGPDQAGNCQFYEGTVPQNVSISHVII